MNVLVVGSGVAGVSAAQRILKNDPSSKVCLCDAEGMGLYARIRLPEYAGGSLTKDKLTLYSPDVIQSWDVEYLADAVAEIDLAEKQARFVSGVARRFDKLLFCTGADARRIELPGMDKAEDRIFTLRSLKDADTIIKAAETAGMAIVLGGGVLGLEIAWHLRQRGLQVVVLECLERLLPRQCTAEGSALLKQRLEEAGVSVELNYVSENISCGENQSGLSLHAKDGRVCKGDFLLISAGMAPRKSLAEKSGIACKNGILVNERLETSCPDVYAAGDCAEGPVRNPGMWICSKEQGEGAADILTGKLEKFTFRERQPMLKIGSLDLTGIRS